MGNGNKIFRASRRACESEIANGSHAPGGVRLSPDGCADTDGDTGDAGRASEIARHGIDFYGKRKCAWRASDKCAPLGTGRTIDVRLAYWRISLLGSSSLLPTFAWRRLCNRGGVHRAKRAMGSSIPQDSLNCKKGERKGGNVWNRRQEN